MKNLWPEKFEENTSPTVATIVETQAQLLSSLTDGVVYAEVTRLEGLDAKMTLIDADFTYAFTLVGKFIGDYKFRVCVFAHSITLYPVRFRFEEEIAKEVGIKGYPYEITIDSHEKIEPLLRTVLTTERIKKLLAQLLGSAASKLFNERKSSSSPLGISIHSKV